MKGEGRVNGYYFLFIQYREYGMITKRVPILAAPPKIKSKILHDILDIIQKYALFHFIILTISPFPSSLTLHHPSSLHLSPPFTLHPHPSPLTLHLSAFTIHPSPFALPSPFTLRPSLHLALRSLPLCPSPFTLYPSPFAPLLHTRTQISRGFVKIWSTFVAFRISCGRAPLFRSTTRHKIARYIYQKGEG